MCIVINTLVWHTTICTCLVDIVYTCMHMLYYLFIHIQYQNECVASHYFSYKEPLQYPSYMYMYVYIVTAFKKLCSFLKEKNKLVKTTIVK